MAICLRQAYANAWRSNIAKIPSEETRVSLATAPPRSHRPVRFGQNLASDFQVVVVRSP